MRRQGQSRGAQVQAMYLSDQKGWSQDPAIPRPHLRVGSGGEGILLESPAYLRSSESKQLPAFISVCMAASFKEICTCCGLRHCSFAALSLQTQWR